MAHGGRTQGGSNPLEFLRNRPEFQLLRRAVRGNPEILGPMLQVRGKHACRRRGSLPGREVMVACRLGGAARPPLVELGPAGLLEWRGHYLLRLSLGQVCWCWHAHQAGGCLNQSRHLAVRASSSPGI